MSNIPQITARSDGDVAVDWSAAPEPPGPFITLTRQQWLGLITSIRRSGARLRPRRGGNAAGPLALNGDER